MKKNSKYYELIKNTGILTVGNFSSKILIFFLIPIYTAALTTEEYGFYELANTTIQLLFPIISLNLVDGVLRFILDKKSDIEQIYCICNKFIIYSCVLGALIIWIISTFDIYPELSQYAGYIWAYYIVYAYNSLYLQIAKATDNVKAIAVTGILSAVTLFGLTVLLLANLNMGLRGFFIANILSQGIGLIYYIKILKPWKYRIPFIKIDKTLQKKLINYSLPLLLTTLCWWVNSSSDRYIVSFFCGIGVSGLLSVAYKIPNIISTITGIFTQAWQISAIKQYDEQKKDDFYQVTFVYLNLFVCCAVAFCIPITKMVASLIFAKEYFVAWKFIPFLLVSTVFNVGSGFLGPILNAGYNVKAVAKSGLYGMILNVVLNIALTYLVGAQGVTIATVISSYAIYYIRKKSVNDIFEERSYRKILLVWGMLIMSSIIYVFTEITWFSILVFIFIIYIFRNEFISIIKNVRCI